MLLAANSTLLSPTAHQRRSNACWNN